MFIPFVRSHVGGAVAAFTFMLGAAPVFGAGFQLNETSASGLGTAFAGGAASAEDASTMWSNVAGMSRIRTGQVVGAIHFITPSLKFKNEASSPAAAQTLGGEGGDAGGLNVVPNLYVVAPLNRDWSIGLGVNAPFGLVTEYDDGWMGRFQGVKSAIETINVNPGVAWKPASSVSLGLGLNLQHMSAEFTQQVNYAGALFQAAAAHEIALDAATQGALVGLESGARIKGSDNAVGWNAGVLWEIDNNTRIGAQYRSAMSYHLTGEVTYSNPTLPASLPPVVGVLAAAVNAQLSGTGISADVKLPPIVNLSYFGKLNDRWDLMADAQWTGWSTIETLQFMRSDGTTLQTTPENFKDSWKLAVGANYRYSDTVMFRGGLAVDQSPVRTEFRTPRLPDADRTWLGAGLQYTVNTKLKFDVGAAYLWVKKGTIDISGNPSNVAGNGLINGHYDNSTLIVSAQASYAF